MSSTVEGTRRPVPKSGLSKEERLENNNIVLRINAILDHESSLSWNNGSPAVKALFRNSGLNDRKTTIRLGKGESKGVQEQDTDFGDVPKSFKFPVYFITGSRTIDTPNGQLPEAVRGPDSEIYYPENTYFFNKTGQVAKKEKFVPASPKAKDKYKDVELPKIDNVSEIKPTHTRINQGDYGKIREWLTGIESGGFVQNRYS